MSEFILTPVEPSAGDVQFLEDRIYESNSQATRIVDGGMLAFFVREDDAVVAGICGNTWGGTCELRQLWVEESRRHHGLGTRLLQAAEGEARRRGCALVFFHAYDVLAAGLYERLGYETVGVVEGCPAGSAVRWFRKLL